MKLMTQNQYETLLDAISGLKLKGYVYSFNYINEGLYCPETKQTFGSENIEIIEIHRFKAISEVSVVYAVEAGNIIKGIIIDAFGVYAGSGLGEFIAKSTFQNCKK